MKKLLVTGDSFGQFPRGQEHRTFYGIRPLENPSDHDHWCELWAKDAGMEPVNHAVGGANISSTSFIAMQELLANDYDTCVFHVSHHSRTLNYQPSSYAEWKEKLFPMMDYNPGLDWIYDPELYSLHSPEFTDRRSGETHRLPRLIQSQINSFAKNPDFDDTTNNNDITYWTHKAPYSYIHDSVTAVLALRAFCESKGVDLILVNNFGVDTCMAINALGIDMDYFNVTELERKYGFGARGGMNSHYNQAEHELIYSEFCEWQKKVQ